MVGRGFGDLGPDASIADGQAQVRAERDGFGNGRVYRIAFEAEDGRGGRCDGAVTICVPHDRGAGRTCSDDGQDYDSLGGSNRVRSAGPRSPKVLDPIMRLRR